MTVQDRAARHLLIRSETPLNAETRSPDLVARFVTPQQRFYIRSHGDVPALAADTGVEVAGLVRRPSTWTRAALEERFATRTVPATMQCAGNRRGDLQQVAPTSGDPWGPGAIGHAEWTGVRLADLLADAGLVEGRARHVRFLGADTVTVDGDTDRYGVSLPLAKALHPDTLIAWAMNDEPLLPEHGFPLRLVVPGWAGVRSAKWLTRIEVSDAPAPQPIQARDYKLFPASVAKDEADWSEGLVIDALPLNAAICLPMPGAEMPAGPVTVSGYATAGERGVARVELSPNGGRDWFQATMDRQAGEPWSWVQWRWRGDLRVGSHELVVRAVDTAGQSQPSRPEDVWNFAGYLSAAWHRVRVTAV